MLRIRENRDHYRELLAFYRRFAKEEEGSVTIFACFMIFMMMMVAGIGVDMMRHEMERTRVQAIADRAVLAAADLDQTLDAEAVVRDYFEKAGMGDYVISVVPEIGDGYRIVTVNSGVTLSTQFMDFLGVDRMHVGAVSTAEERVPKVEISLVLDISGSMRNSNRMEELRPAAVSFIDTILADDVKEKTSVTLIPYAGQTNVGPFMFERLNGERYGPFALDADDGGVEPNDQTGYLAAEVEGGEGPDEDIKYVFPNVSSCLEIAPTDFADISLPSGTAYDQTAHFMNWKIATETRTQAGYAGWPLMEWGWCPQDGTQIQYFQNNRGALNTFINEMPMHDGTGTHYGMKYAVSMLDPSSSDDVTALIAAGLASSDFAGRPAGYGDNETQKYIILMTDGQITEQVRPIDVDDDQNPSVALKDGRSSEKENITTSSTNIDSFYDQCNLAKTRAPRPVVVYTIAFEAPDSAKTQMRNCASSESHYFSADDKSIAGVFEAIARQINELRLTK